MLAENAAEEAAAAAAMGVRRVGTVEDLQCLEDDLEASSNDRASSGSRYQNVLELHHFGCRATMVSIQNV